MNRRVTVIKKLCTKDADTNPPCDICHVVHTRSSHVGCRSVMINKHKVHSSFHHIFRAKCSFNTVGWSVITISKGFIFVKHLCAKLQLQYHYCKVMITILFLKHVQFQWLLFVVCSHILYQEY